MDEMMRSKSSGSSVFCKGLSLMRTTGSCMENLMLALGNSRGISVLRFSNGARGGFGFPRRSAMSRGKCLGSRSTDGDVTTELANMMLAFFSSALPSCASSTVLEGSVVRTVVVAMGIYTSLSGLPWPSSNPTDIERAAANAS